MLKLIITASLIVLSPLLHADSVEGEWRTESDDNGGYLVVTVGPCEADNAKTCGIISKAFGAAGQDDSYVNLGKPMVMDMETDDGSSFSGGTIWDPSKDKTYKSKMKLDGDDLVVKGCIGFICSGEDWTRVK